MIIQATYIPCKDRDIWSIKALKNEFFQMLPHLPVGTMSIGLHFSSFADLFNYIEPVSNDVHIERVQIASDDEGSKGPHGCYIGHELAEEVKEFTPEGVEVQVFFSTREEACGFHMKRYEWMSS